MRDALCRLVTIGVLACLLPFGTLKAQDKTDPELHDLADALSIAVLLCIDRHPGGRDTAYASAVIASGMMEYLEAIEKDAAVCIASAKVSPGLCDDILLSDPQRATAEYEQSVLGLVRRHREVLRQLVPVNQCIYADARKTKAR